MSEIDLNTSEQSQSWSRRCSASRSIIIIIAK